MIALLFALILAVVQITLLGVFSLGAVTVVPALLAVILAFWFESPRFGWQLAVAGGLLFDLLSTRPFGLWLLFFTVAAILADLVFSYREQPRLYPILVIVTALLAASYEIICLAPINYPAPTVLTVAVSTALLNVIAVVIVAQLVIHFNQPYGQSL